MKAILPKPLTCLNCNKETLRTSVAQRYCPTCAKIVEETKNKLRMKKYSKKEYLVQGKQKRTNLKERGQKINSNQEHIGISYSSAANPSLNPDFGHMLRFWVPFDGNLSKNRKLKVTREGRVYTNSDTRHIMERITQLVLSSQIKWNINKIYLEIIVQKPNMRGDAINFLDAIADAVKKGLPLDDNWFAVEKIDWEIVKKDPRIYISIMQEAEDRYPCSFCGIFKPLTEFGKDKNSKYGITGECKTCLKKS